MTDREKLIEIVKNSLIKHIDKSCCLAENIVDDLLTEGVTSLPVAFSDNRRERMIELLGGYYEETGINVVHYFTDEESEMLADYILADGWIRPPCKVGDTVYYAGVDTPIKFTVIGFSKGRMYDCSVADYEEIVEDNELNVDEWYVHLDSFCGLKQMSPLSSFGKRLFVGDDAEKEAEKALAKRNCDIAQNIESCEDCGFCEKRGASDG